MQKPFKRYRGFRLRWYGTTDGGHWMIFDQLDRFVCSADENELDDTIDEIESEG